MTGTSIDTREAVGSPFSMSTMIDARTKSMQAVGLIATGTHAGMSEQEATEHATRTLHQMGMQRVWHPVIVRFGENTLKTFSEPSDPSRQLSAHDIFYIDIGPVWDGHEGDAGDTFVVGDDLEMEVCATAARLIWNEVADR